jgi:hypothetical protein
MKPIGWRFRVPAHCRRLPGSPPIRPPVDANGDACPMVTFRQIGAARLPRFTCSAVALAGKSVPPPLGFSRQPDQPACPTLARRRPPEAPPAFTREGKCANRIVAARVFRTAPAPSGQFLAGKSARGPDLARPRCPGASVLASCPCGTCAFHARRIAKRIVRPLLARLMNMRAGMASNRQALMDSFPRWKVCRGEG